LQPVNEVEEIARLRREHGLLLLLLDLGHTRELQPLLGSILAAITELTGAELGYLEVFDLQGRPYWAVSESRSDEQIESIRRLISNSIVVEALATGKPIQTPSAQLDPKFAGRPSVRDNLIQAVLCCPIHGEEATGVLYLQGQQAFGQADLDLADLFCRSVGAMIDTVLELERTREESDPTRELRERLNVGRLIGRSEALARVLHDLETVAPSMVHVLLTGPSGTGKNVVARTIHENSPRATGPFVAVNCANLPRHLVESELFGAERGAHSTAHKSRKGRVESAEGGTLFLDEIGELPFDIQSSLLHLLQDKEYYRLGADKPRRADIRIIAATNADIEQRIAERSFRADLYHRLNVFPIAMPALAERRQDIIPLAEHFLARFAKEDGVPAPEISPGARRVLLQGDWAGNIRELENTLRRALLLAARDSKATLAAHHLRGRAGAPGSDADPDPFPSLQEATLRFQQDYIRTAIETSKGNVTQAAELLDVVRATIYNILGR